MSMYTKEHIPLKLAEKNIILQGEWLTDIHMDNFQRLLARCSDYRPVETWRIQCLHTIEPILQNKNIYKYCIVRQVYQMGTGYVVITIKKLYLYTIL